MPLPAQAQVCTDDAVIITGRVLLRGWSMAAATPGTVALYDAAAVADTTRLLATVISTAEVVSSTQWFGEGGILCESGLAVVTTTFVGNIVVWFTPQTLVESMLLQSNAGSDRSIVPFVDQVDIDRLFGRV